MVVECMLTIKQLEAKQNVKQHGTQRSSHHQQKPVHFLKLASMSTPLLALPAPLRGHIFLTTLYMPKKASNPFHKLSLTYMSATPGLTITQNFSTAALLDTKLEFVDTLAPGVKFELQNLWNPSKASSAAQKVNFAFKNPNVHSRGFVNYAQSNGAIDAVVDFVAGHEGFLVGAEAGYDVQKAAVTKYSLGVAYQTPKYTASVTSTQNLQIIAATFYQKVNSSVEVGAKAGYDVQGQKASGLEIASKYKLDPLSFAKAKINDRGIAALAYSTKLNAGTTLGLGLSLDTAKLNEAGHKIGTSLTFEG
jgi:voltage-dependent anion channel protein 2